MQSAALIETIPGNVIDYDRIRAKINIRKSRYAIKEIAIDPWNATQLALQLQGDGHTVVTFGQGFKDMIAPTKELEKPVLCGMPDGVEGVLTPSRSSSANRLLTARAKTATASGPNA